MSYAAGAPPVKFDANGKSYYDYGTQTPKPAAVTATPTLGESQLQYAPKPASGGSSLAPAPAGGNGTVDPNAAPSGLKSMPTSAAAATQPGVSQPDRMPIIPPAASPPPPQVVPFQPPVGPPITNIPPGTFGGPGITGGPDPQSLQGVMNYSTQDRPGSPGVVGAGPSGGFTIQGSPGVQAAYQTPTGQSLAQDPSLKAAVDAFNQYQRPTIENQMELAGLGRSNAAGNATSLALGQQLAPFMESAFGREESAINRGSQATENELNRRQALDINQSNANLATIPYLMNMGQDQYGRQLGQINAASQFGGLQQGVEQAGNDAAYQDFLRRQGLAEQGTYAPFGATIPSAFGSNSITSKS